MEKIIKLFKYLIQSPEVVLGYIWRQLSPIIPAKLYLKVQYRLRLGYWMDFENPSTFNEKLLWLKVYDHRPEYIKFVDKYEVKHIVSKLLGDEFLIPTLGVWNSVDEINFDFLPNQFVLKCTHDSGGLIICKDKNNLDIEKAKKKLKKCLATNYYHEAKEWPYKHVPHRIIAEQFIVPPKGTEDLPDYKFFCFDGKVKALFVATDRQTPGVDVKFDFFDADYNHLPLKQGHENASITPPKPANFEIMKSAAEKLSSGYPHIRVDFYDQGDKVLFGELTLYHFGGLTPFNPQEWDEKFGEMLTLPTKSSN